MNMVGSKVEFNWDAIKYFDDRVCAAFNVELRDILKDLQMRPGLPEARKIVITVELVPKPQSDERDADVNAEITFTVRSGKPVRKSAPKQIALLHNQQKGFFHADHDDPRQAGLLDRMQVPEEETVATKRTQAD